MQARIRFVGLDVHKDTVVIAIADEGAGPPEVFAEIPHEPARILALLRKLGPLETLRVCYEARLRPATVSDARRGVVRSRGTVAGAHAERQPCEDRPP